MNKIYEEFFKYGFHDTEISSIIIEEFKVKINFDKGLYLLDVNGKETVLSEPMVLILNINPSTESIENNFDIREYGQKDIYVEFKDFQKYLNAEPFSISMNYYSEFSKSILFDGGFSRRQFMFSIEEIIDIQFKKRMTM